MAKVGRPTKYEPGVCGRLIEFFNIEPWKEMERTVIRKDGSEVIETYRVPNDLPLFSMFCVKENINRDTLNEWVKIYPELSVAYQKAKAFQEHILVTNGMNNLYQTAFAIFTAKNLIGWRDTQHLEAAVKHEHCTVESLPFDGIKQRLTQAERDAIPGESKRIN